MEHSKKHVRESTNSKPPSGIYHVKIICIEETPSGYYLWFDIAVGPWVGWASSLYQLTGSWPLKWYINNVKGTTVLQYALTALGVKNPKDAIDRNLRLEIESGDYIVVRRSFPVDLSSISPSDLRYDTTRLAADAPCRETALRLASLSGLPVMLVDTNETNSPVFDWCFANKIVALPTHFQFGDYTLSGCSAVVDRKADLAELYDNFVKPNNRVRYENAARLAQAFGKKLIYVVATSPTDNVITIQDLFSWNGYSYKGVQISGAKLAYKLLDHKAVNSNVDFMFVPQEQVSETIYKILCSYMP